MPTTTAAVIISDALKEILVIGEGEAPSATMLSDGLRMLNRLLDTLSNNNDFAYFASMEQKALTGQQILTIGPTGDIVTTRPIKVETAVVDRNGITYPVKVIDNEKYDDLTYKALAGANTQAVYYEAAREPLQGRRAVAQFVPVQVSAMDQRRRRTALAEQAHHLLGREAGEDGGGIGGRERDVHWSTNPLVV